MKEEQLSKQIASYEQIAKENPNIDIASLMISSLQHAKENNVPSAEKKLAYVISTCIPPIGLLISIKYFYSEKDDAKSVAWTCVSLTLFSLFIAWILSKAFFTTPTNVNTIQTIPEYKPSSIQQILE